MEAPNTEVWLALISMVGGIVGTFLTVKYKNQRTINATSNTQSTRQSRADRESNLYDGYERLIKQIEGNLNSVKHELDETERANAQLRTKLDTLESTVDQLRAQLTQVTQSNTVLRDQNQRLAALAQQHGIDTTGIYTASA